MPTNVIYKPKGKALEYGELALNLYEGCGFGCKYCYCNDMRFLNFWEKSQNPKPKKDIIKRLELELERRTIKKRVFLSFTSDPFQIVEWNYGVTGSALEILNEAKVPFNVLTKGSYDLMELHRNTNVFNVGDSQVGFTLTSFGDLQKKWEPRAPCTEDRISALRELTSEGIYTWVSIEPLLDVEQACEIIKQTCFVDHIWVGKCNHGHNVPEPTADDLAKIMKTAVGLGVPLKFKSDTQQILDAGRPFAV